MSEQDQNPKNHLPGEARPQDATVDLAPSTGFGLHDSAWSEDQWRTLLVSFVEEGLASWRELAALVLGHLNPSQVGTSLASSDGFKRRYGKGNTMRVVMDWAYAQTGRCEDCGSRLELQADHIKGREQFSDPLDADFIENMTLRCRRCNVIRRPSHEYGGQTFLTAESALMWILLVIKPRTLTDFIRLCRIYGMTMADIRMQEAWAMAHWLSKDTPPPFGIEDDENTHYDVLLWDNGAITRVDAGVEIPNTAERIYANIQGDNSLAFIAEIEDGRKKLFLYPFSFIPFSSYDLGDMPPNGLAVRYTPPDRANGGPQQISPLAPAGMTLVSHAVVSPSEQLMIEDPNSFAGTAAEPAPETSHNGKLLPAKLQGKPIRLATRPT